MSFVKKLAGETVIYGMSSILPRVINYLFFTIYITYKFDDTTQYGIYNELYAYATIILILFTFRMETAFFRFGSKNENQEKIFGTAFLPVILIALTGIAVMYFNADSLAGLIEYEYGGYYVKWFAFILGFDALAAMFYARFRLQSRPIRFMFYRILNVIITLFLVFLFLEILPRMGINWLEVKEQIDYVFLANLIASGIILVLMLPEFLKVKFTFEKATWVKMFWYSLPLVIVGIAGNINQVFAAPLQKFFLGEDVAENLATAGKYMGPAKIALLINLFTTAFNYAAEPFFFNNVGKKDSEKAYGQIIHSFAIAAGIAMMGIVCFQEIAILIIGEEYRGPQEIIPILVFSYFFLGLYYNISIWYKLSDKTIYGALISIGGAIITLAISISLLPRIGYIASAWASLACFTFMMITGYVLGQKYYPINYPVKTLLRLIFFIGLFMAGAIYFKTWATDDIMKIVIGTVVFCLFIVLIFFTEWKKVRTYLISNP